MQVGRFRFEPLDSNSPAAFALVPTMAEDMLVNLHSGEVSKRKKRKHTPAIDLSDLPEDFGELHDYLTKKTTRVIAKHAAIAERLADALANMDLDSQNVAHIATALGTSTKRLADVGELLTQATPRMINVTVEYPVPTADKTCPICGTSMPNKDTTGFDPPEDE